MYAPSSDDTELDALFAFLGAVALVALALGGLAPP
jgi:hypothetical protein